MADGFDPIVMSELISAHKGQLTDMGLSVRFSADFSELEALLPVDRKEALTEHFRTSLNTYTEANAFWLGGMDSDGRLVALCAARLDDLGTENLGDYLKKYWRRCYPGKTEEKARPAAAQPRFWREMSGRVAYYGDFLLQREGYQGRGLPKIFAPLCVLLGMQKWSPDWHYCWINPGDWAKRYPLGYGFAQVHGTGLRWDVPPETISDDLVVAVNSRSNALDWMDQLQATCLKASNN